MPKLIVLYPPPADVTTFERRYHSEHAPMVVQKIPGLKKFLAAQVLGTPVGTWSLNDGFRARRRYYRADGTNAE